MRRRNFRSLPHGTRAASAVLPKRRSAARAAPLLAFDAPARGSSIAGPRGGRPDRVRSDMEVFIQQLINGITLGSIYRLIAIGYTMVFGIIGMVNFAHGDVFMVSAFIALITLLVLTTWLGVGSILLALLIVLIVAMLLTSLVNWTIERVAYRPLRGSFRLA